ncbi:hypothetical protein [Nonomuraea gerenzanensis]|uniref:Uncharacterized protein n=1 Tax=Nonomuraea gerenzanensis TaxID=93944 RepID=A0A1M4E4D4_9ACTN|nr:hypothetical protein [Nonomuraea gerenzanensis]UBU15853.1 hypothetical protein LCN96_12830 [Nonomuraea gerenzanensis]SBO93644.1 hypothetical protein BN4615_P3158 [Nonomuraea gerenzanensis]
MLKRRLAIVATSAVLGLGVMAGSALADEGPVRVHGEHGKHGDVAFEEGPGFHGGRLTCWMSDGEVVKLSRAKVTELVEARYIEPELAAPDGVAVVPGDRLSISVPAKKLPREVVKKKLVGKRWHHSRVIHLTCVWSK